VDLELSLEASWDPFLLIHVRTMLDGNYVLALYLDPNERDGCVGYRCGMRCKREKDCDDRVITLVTYHDQDVAWPGIQPSKRVRRIYEC
jgi:hypothetical protein